MDKALDRIVVGVDGSAESMSALDLAAEEAASRVTPLIIVHVSSPAAGLEDRSASAKRLLSTAVSRALAEHPALPVSAELLCGAPVDALVDRARQAGLLVIGHSPRCGARKLGLSSVAHQVVPFVARWRRAAAPPPAAHGLDIPHRPEQARRKVHSRRLGYVQFNDARRPVCRAWPDVADPGAVGPPGRWSERRIGVRAWSGGVWGLAARPGRLWRFTAGRALRRRRVHATPAVKLKIMAGSAKVPVLYVVDRDPGSLGVLLADLSRRFGGGFAVRGESSHDAAVAALRQAAESGEPVALILVDDGESDFLVTAHELHPHAKRVLLVDRDYTATSPAVRALRLGRADYHLVQPWSNDELLYGPMSEYLLAWTMEQEPNFEQFRIVAVPGDARVSQLHDVMTRFGMPHGTYSATSDTGRRLLEGAGLDSSHLPVVIRYDGQVMIDPGLPELAQAIGVSVQQDHQTCDLAIVGAGPAGLTAAVYAASEGLDTVLLEEEVSGGQAGSSPLIRNYPGFPHGISGGLLMARTREQAWLMGAHVVFAQRAVGLQSRGRDRVVLLMDGSRLRARTVVIATGIQWRRLGVAGLEALVGSGVFYGAAVGESRAVQDQDVYIVGGGNSAGQAALHLAGHARTVTLLVRGDGIATSMSRYLVSAIESAGNIVVRTNTETVGGGGSDGTLDYLVVADRGRGVVERVPADALFIMIGGEPNTRWLPPEVMRDSRGYLLTGHELLEHGAGGHHRREPSILETSIPGVFAAGDVRHGSIKRVASAVGEGATVVRLVHDYLRLAEREPAY